MDHVGQRKGSTVTEVRTALGLMSGTSLDGIDVAVLRTDGERIQGFGPARTFPYSDADKAVLRDSLREASTLTDRLARPGILADADRLVTQRHAEAVDAFLSAADLKRSELDLIGFHGQTVFHDAQRGLTVQIGDGESLAAQLGVPVVWDFRAADVAAGGQGAPLVPVFHRALMAFAEVSAPAAFLNVGGVANATFIDSAGNMLSFDTGPGNALLDDWIRSHQAGDYDANGAIAAGGAPSEPHLASLLSHPYFEVQPPKSLDRNTFQTQFLRDLGLADGAATLLHFTARSISRAARHASEAPKTWIVCGGGRHNCELMRLLGEFIPSAKVLPAEAVGLDGDAVEAQAFAFLAVRSVDRKPITFPLTTGVPEPLSGGRQSLPDAA